MKSTTRISQKGPSLFVKCRVCGQRFRVTRPMVVDLTRPLLVDLYERVAFHVQDNHSFQGLSFRAEMDAVNLQLPEGFLAAVREGRDWPGCPAPRGDEPDR